MAHTAYLPIIADRYGALVRHIFVVGLDLTGLDMRAQVRLYGDVPGVPLVDLAPVANGNAQGLRLVEVTSDDDGLPTSHVEIVINETTLELLPYAGEIGDATTLAWDWQVTIAGRKRRLAKGEFQITGDGVTGAELAPASRIQPFGLPQRPVADVWSTARMTFGEEQVTVQIDGADLIAPLAKKATDASVSAAADAQRAGLAAGAAQATARYFTTRAAGEAASAVDQSFATDDGAGNIIYYHRTAGGSVEIGRAVTPDGLASVGGAAQVGFKQVASGPAMTAEIKLRERVTTSGYGSDANALQAAIDSGAPEVIVNNVLTVSKGVTLRSNQIVRFAGGKIVVAVDGDLSDGKPVMNCEGGQNITILDAVIDATARPASFAVTGIRLLNVVGARIVGGRLTRASVKLESYDNSVSRALTLADMVIAMDGHPGTGAYISGVRGVSVRGVECFGGKEGFGVYNGARAISFGDCRSHHHSQDGFLVLDGQEITHVNCHAQYCGQSGFTSQRLSQGANARITSWIGCQAVGNAYDGFDLRGKAEAPAFGVDTGFMLSSCMARGNVRCGFYVVLSEGTTLDACTGILNQLQNLFIDTSDRVIATGFRSISGCSSVESGGNKAGVLVYNSDGVQICCPISSNAEGAHQDFGVSFTGNSKMGKLIGGDLSNNAVGPFNAGSNDVAFAAADTLGGTGVFFEAVDARGVYREKCVSPPLHYRPAGSQCQRVNGGAELYISTATSPNNPSWRVI